MALNAPRTILLAIIAVAGIAPAAAAQTCQFPVSPPAVEVPAAGGTYRIYVNPEPAGATCPWTIVSPDSWATITNVHNPATGQGYFDVEIAATAPGAERKAFLYVNGGGIGVVFTQARLTCDFTISAEVHVEAPAGGATQRFAVTTAPAGTCAWTAEAFVPWLSIAEQAYAGGGTDGHFEVASLPNTSGAHRYAIARVSLLSDPGRYQDLVIAQPRLRPTAPRFAEFAGNFLGEYADAFIYDPATGWWDIYTPGAAWSALPSYGSHARGRGAGAVPPGASVYAADFNGDGLQDIFAYNPSTGEWRRGINRGFNTQECTPDGCSRQRFDLRGGLWAPGWGVTIADLDGDGHSDLFLYNPSSGMWASALMRGASGDFVYGGGAWAPGWSIYRARLNADDADDLFLYNASPVDPNGGRWFAVVSLGNGQFDYHEGAPRWAPGWTVAQGDFDGDGRTEIFLYGHLGSGRWYMVDFPNGDQGDFTGLYREGLWAPGWSLTVGEFNGDGRDDLFLYNNTGAGPFAGWWFYVYSLGAGEFDYRPYDVPWAQGWKITVTDLDDDGRDDLLMRLPGSGLTVTVYARPAGTEYLYGVLPDQYEWLLTPFRLLR